MKWTAATRASYLKSNPENFAGPGDTFPIKDAEDVKNAWDLAGHGDNPVEIRSKVKSIAARLHLSGHVPGTIQMTEWLGSDEDDAAIAPFSITDAVAVGTNFVRNGKVFHVGDFPDKKFSLTADEAKVAIAAFKPVNNKGAHVPTIFDGKMGTLDSVHLADDGVTIVGQVTIPKWLQDLHGAETPLQASLEWDRNTKLITGNTLVPNPRIEDSVLMAAFATEPTNFASKVEMKAAMQTFHDMSLGAGASCNPSRSDYAYTSSTQKLHDLTAQYGASCHVGMSAKASLIDTFKAMFGLDDHTDPIVVPAKVEETIVMSVTKTPEMLALEAQLAEATSKIEAQGKQMAGFAADNRRIKAEAIVGQYFAARKVVPAQTNVLTALFAHAMEIDEAGGTVNFTDDAKVEHKVSMVEALKSVFTDASTHGLTVEALSAHPMFTIPQTTESTAGGEDDLKTVRERAVAFAKRQNGTEQAAGN